MPVARATGAAAGYAKKPVVALVVSVRPGGKAATAPLSAGPDLGQPGQAVLGRRG